MKELFCIRCGFAAFLDPKKEICYKTGGLFCRKLKKIVCKYDPCHIRTGPGKGKGKKRA